MSKINSIFLGTSGIGKTSDAFSSVNTKLGANFRKTFAHLGLRLNESTIIYNEGRAIEYGVDSVDIYIQGQRVPIGIPVSVEDFIAKLNNLDIGWAEVDSNGDINMIGFQDYGDIVTDSVVGGVLTEQILFIASSSNPGIAKPSLDDVLREVGLRLNLLENSPAASVVDSFQDLIDGFAFPGNNGTIPMVDEADNTFLPAMFFVEEPHFVKSATDNSLPGYVYANGSSGVGATITISRDGHAPDINGIPQELGDRFLYKDGTSTKAKHNGIYYWSVIGDDSTQAVATRAADSDETQDFTYQVVVIEQGDEVNKGRIYTQLTFDPVVGTTSINYDKWGRGTKYAWAADGNNFGTTKYFGTNDNFDIPIYTNATERARWFKTGQLGFNITASPQGTLHITGLTGVSPLYLKTSDSSHIFEFTHGGVIKRNSFQYFNAVGTDTFTGSRAGESITTQNLNAGFGYRVGLNMSASPGTFNALFGANVALTLTDGNGNTLIGGNTDVSGASAIGQIALGAGATVGQDHEWRIGSATYYIDQIIQQYSATGQHGEYFRTSTPEGAQAARRASLAFVDDTSRGSLFLKTIATTSSGWDEVATLAAPQTFTTKVLDAATITTSLLPTSDDGAALGSTSRKFSDLFLASGAVINFAAGDITITHASNNLLFAGASSGYTFDAKVYPTSDDGAALGDTTHNFSDLFLASGAVINFNAGDVTITHSSNTLAYAGASSGYSFDALVVPAANDGAPLGSTSLQWSDLFLAEGGVINWDNGDATLTQVGDVVTLAGADLKVSSPGNVANSALTTDGTQTVTNKTIGVTQLSGSANTFAANNTGSTANYAEKTYKNVDLTTYGGTLTWDGTAPTSIVSQQYAWNQVEHTVTLIFAIEYTNAGVANTTVSITLPSDCPTPATIAGMGDAANEIGYLALGAMTTGSNVNPPASRCSLGVNAGNNGYIITIIQASTASKVARFTVQYRTA